MADLTTLTVMVIAGASISITATVAWRRNGEQAGRRRNNDVFVTSDGGLGSADDTASGHHHHHHQHDHAGSGHGGH